MVKIAQRRVTMDALLSRNIGICVSMLLDDQSGLAFRRLQIFCWDRSAPEFLPFHTHDTYP